MQPETDELHANGTKANAAIRIQATVRQDRQLELIKDLIRGMITSAIPSIVWSAITGLLGDPSRS